MRARVAELLEENRKLPESERIDENEFELDVEEQQRRVNDGEDKEDDLRFELKAWQLARQKVGQKIRKKVWDDMEVKGRSINGMKVRNFFPILILFSIIFSKCKYDSFGTILTLICNTLQFTYSTTIQHKYQRDPFMVGKKIQDMSVRIGALNETEYFPIFFVSLS